MLTIFRGPSGEGGPPNGNEGGSIWKYDWSVRQCCETIFSIFVVEEPGIKLKFVWQFAIGGGLTKPRKTSNLTLGKSPRMRCGGNLSGGENKQKQQSSALMVDNEEAAKITLISLEGCNWSRTLICLHEYQIFLDVQDRPWWCRCDVMGLGNNQ